MSRYVFIYALCEPDATEEERYIGKAVDPWRRYDQHLEGAKFIHGSSYKKDCWIRFLMRQETPPVLKLLAQVPEENWQWWEQFFIADFRARGFSLLNLTDGGEGGEFSEATKAKMSASWTPERRTAQAERMRAIGVNGTGRKKKHASSQFFGVARIPNVKGDSKKWTAHITVEGRSHYLGSFYYETNAASTYDIWAIRHYGDTAKLNFPNKVYTL